MTKITKDEVASFKYSGEPVKFSLGTLVMLAFCIFLIIISTFTQLPIIDVFNLDKGTDSTGLLLSDYLSNSSIYSYIPQLPAIFFTVALLDRRYGLTAIILYILLGLFVIPVFGMGGGFHYIYEYGFGFIIAYIPAAFLTATIIKHNFHILNILKAVIAGVFAIHLIGVVYMLFISTLFHTTGDIITGWISSQSGAKIFYDIIFSTIAIYIANLLKQLLWLIIC